MLRAGLPALLLRRAQSAQRRGLAASSGKIKVAGPVVELDGDEMARIMWRKIREQLVLPYVDVDLRYYDLSFENRDATDDRVTVESAEAILDCNVGVKCATITGTPERLEEFGFSKLYRSPNGTIRNILDGVVMREPIVMANVPRMVTSWKSPIVVARHAHGDQYKATDFPTSASGGKLTLRFEPNGAGEEVIERVVHEFDGPGVALAMYNTEKSIEGFARGSLAYAKARGLPCVMGTKNTILKQYDDAFVRIFAEVHAAEFSDVDYSHRLIDDLVAYMLKNEHPVLYALKNYDGDVISDITAQGFGSLGNMTSVLVCPHDQGRTIETEAAHGTVTRHFRAHQRGEATSTNPVASIYAWTRGLAHRGRLDGNTALEHYAAALEGACVSAVEGGCMTKDLAICALGWEEGTKQKNWATTDEYIAEIRVKLDAALAEGKATAL